jgi:hypothetical protein
MDTEQYEEAVCGTMKKCIRRRKQKNTNSSLKCTAGTEEE